MFGTVTVEVFVAMNILPIVDLALKSYFTLSVTMVQCYNVKPCNVA